MAKVNVANRTDGKQSPINQSPLVFKKKMQKSAVQKIKSSSVMFTDQKRPIVTQEKECLTERQSTLIPELPTTEKKVSTVSYLSQHTSNVEDESFEI